MRERLIIYRNLWLYTHVGVPILLFIAFIKFWRTLDLYFRTVDLICPLLFCLQNYLHGDALLHEVLGICIFSNQVSDLLILNEFDFKQAKMGRENYHGNISDLEISNACNMFYDLWNMNSFVFNDNLHVNNWIKNYFCNTQLDYKV